MNIQSQESSYINILRVVLIIGVVFTHSTIPVQQPYNYSNITFDIIYLWQNILGEFRVPAFFLLSGYFFFTKEGYFFNYKSYISKIHKRIYTLIIPYIIWSFVAFLFYKIFSLVKGEITNENIFLSFTKSLFYYNGSIIYPFPINGPLWYIRDLILLTFVSPIIFLIVTRLKRIWIFITLLLFSILPYLQIPMSLFITGVIWFSIGSYLSINQKQLISWIKPFNFLYYIYPLFVLINLFSIGNPYSIFINQLTIIFGTFFIIKLVFSLCEYWDISYHNTGSVVMFIYCSHFIVDFIKIIYMHIIDNNYLILIHYLIALTTIVICSLSYYVLNKICPNILRITLGNRK